MRRLTYKYRVYPTRAQCSTIQNHLSMCRHLYNWALANRIEYYQNTKQTLNYNQQAAWLVGLKKEKPWYKNVYSQVLQNVLKRLHLAFDSFFRRLKNKETPGFPKFRKRGQWHSLHYPQHKEVPDESGRVRVPKIGILKLQYHRPIPMDAQIKTMEIICDGGKYYVSFSCVLPHSSECNENTDVLGLDMGVTDFVYCSDGSHITAPRFYRKTEKQLAQLGRRYARLKVQLKGLKKPSPLRDRLQKNLKKCILALQKAHAAIRNRRLNFLHHAANALLAKGYGVIALEDLNLSGLLRRPKPKLCKVGKPLPNGAAAKAGLNKSIADVGWFSFTQILQYKAAQLGVQIQKVPPHYTSQDCSQCGYRQKKSLSTRTHKCSECGYTAHRDLNAALNIASLGKQTLELSSS